MDDGYVAKSGRKYLRVWGFNDETAIPSPGTVWYQYLSGIGSIINTGPDGLQLLNAVVRAAEQAGFTLIVNFANNCDAYGGIQAYEQAFGISHNEWFTSVPAQAQYCTSIDAVVGRYRASEAIFAWELANEPRCPGCNTDVICGWAETTSRHIKGLDPGRKIIMGDEGFGLPGSKSSWPYTYSEDVDWEKNMGIETLDFGTFHLYPDSCVS